MNNQITINGDNYSYEVTASGETRIYDDDMQWPIFTMPSPKSDAEVINLLHGYRKGLEIGIKLGRSRLQTELKLCLEF